VSIIDLLTTLRTANQLVGNPSTAHMQLARGSATLPRRSWRRVTRSRHARAARTRPRFESRIRARQKQAIALRLSGNRRGGALEALVDALSLSSAFQPLRGFPLRQLTHAGARCN
jgi:hypothetical protein